MKLHQIEACRPPGWIRQATYRGTLKRIIHMGVAQVPEPLVRGHQAFHVPPAGPIRSQRPACKHHFQNMKKLFRNLEIPLIAGVVESDQYLVG